MTIEVMMIIMIVIIVIIFGLGSLFWYAFRFEVANFQMIDNKIYLKNDSNQNSLYSKAESTSKNNIPNEKFALKVLHLSDFHLRNDVKGEKLRKFLKILALDSYDFIFITGDMVEKDELQDELIETLKHFKAKYGIYAVFGAHDYYNKKPAEFIKNMFKKRELYSRKNNIKSLREKLESIGIKVLQNENVILGNTAGYGGIDIIGVDDPIINKMDLNKSFIGIFKDNKVVKIINNLSNDLSLKNSEETSETLEAVKTSAASNINLLSDLIKQNKLLESNLINEQNEIKNQRNQYLINTLAIKKTKEYEQTFSLSEDNFHKLNEKNRLKIALIHTPDSYALVNLALNGIDVVFAGHTHGGQVRLPFKGAIISGCNLKTKYAAGLFYFKKFVLQVSKGLGEGKFSKFRIYCDPEAIITYLIKK